MNKELLNELKDAGFPLSWRDDEPTDTVQGRKYFDPTLEELIEACGVPFYRLHKLDKDIWMADDVEGGNEEHGSTPSIAVAKLWLALHANHQS